MISIEELAELLNDEITEDCMDSVIELWNDREAPFDPEHPAIEPVLEKIVEKLNERINFDIENEIYD